MNIETKMKLERYVPFIRCCNDGNLKISWAQVFQALVILLITTLLTTSIVNHTYIREISKDLEWIKKVAAANQVKVDENEKVVIKNCERLARIEEILKMKERENRR